MPTTLGSRSLTPAARLKLDAMPFVVVVFLSILFALAFWSAFAPNPMPTGSIASAQLDR